MFRLIPILAAGGTITFLIALISFAVWLWNVFHQNQNAPMAGRRPQPQPGGKKPEAELQAEIKRFLNNVMGQKQEPEDELEVLVVEDENEPPRRRQKPRSKAEAAKRKNAAATAQAASQGSEGPGDAPRPGGRIAQRKGPGSTTLGSGVRQHVAEHMQEGRVRQQAEAHLAHGVAEKVERDLGAFSAAGSAPAKSDRTDSAVAVAKMLRDPAGVKQAFILSLILTRPSFSKRQ